MAVFDVPTVATNWYFALAVVLFSVGAFGVMTQRSGIKLLMSIEMLLNAAHINFVAFSSMYGQTVGYTYALFGIAIAAAEAAIGLAILVNLFRTRQTVDADQVTTLRW